MPVVRRARAFTLIEAMIVVVIVGILALVASVAYRKWVRNSYLGEAQDMLGNIRSAEETFRAENTGYLTISTDLTSKSSLYPTTNPIGNQKTQWGSAPGAWASLNVNPSAPVRFGYAVVANNDGTVPLPAVTENGVAANLGTMQAQPWYAAVAICDIDSDGASPDTTIYAVSATNHLFMNNEGQ